MREVDSKYRLIAEIVANLLENACKYTEENAQIGILLFKSGIIVFDNGKKITAEERELDLKQKVLLICLDHDLQKCLVRKSVAL